MMAKLYKYANYKYLIFTLIAMLLAMLYLGNYNLIEGNTQQQMQNKLLQSLTGATNIQTTMETIPPVDKKDKIDCKKVNTNSRNNVSQSGGVNTKAGTTLDNATKLQVKLAGTNDACLN